MTIRSTHAPIDQLGFVTEDLDHAVQSWIARFGVGPWTIYRNVVLEGDYLGRAAKVEIDVALSYRGEQQIEFIQVTSKSPSPYQDAQGQTLTGLHHIAWIVEISTQPLCSSKLSGSCRSSRRKIRRYA